MLGLRNAEGKPYVIIGGQAVGYWAETYLDQEPGLAQWLPFASKDIDFQGDRDDVLRIAKVLGVRAQLPGSRDMTALAGIIPLKISALCPSTISRATAPNSSKTSPASSSAPGGGKQRSPSTPWWSRATVQPAVSIL